MKGQVLAGMVGRDVDGRLTVRFEGRGMKVLVSALTTVTVPVSTPATTTRTDGVVEFPRIEIVKPGSVTSGGKVEIRNVPHLRARVTWDRRPAHGRECSSRSPAPLPWVSG